MKKNIGIIIQSRLTSKRFPKKVMQKINGLSISEILLKRISKIKNITKIIFTIPKNTKNNPLFFHLKSLNVQIYRGEEKNVLSRYYNCAKENKIDIIIRITGDCPLSDPKLIDKMISIFKKEKLDYVSTSPKSFPDGFDVEVFSFRTLKYTFLKAKKAYDLEHVTSFIRRNKNRFKIKEINFENNFKFDNSFVKLSLDTKENLKKIRNVFNLFKPNIFFSIDEIFTKKNFAKIFKAELRNKDNLFVKTKTGQKIWNKAKKVIAGGNMILSKSPERFLPDLWPSYFKSAKGCKINDYDNNSYLDMSLMGVGTNVLGYANNLIDESVRKSIFKGNMSTLNCREEVDLADKLISLHPWFDQVKFARTGGEANSIAIRIARAFSGKDNVAICGYHGWHDWYLSANLKNRQKLDEHLLKGLETKGVPKKLLKTVFPFRYGNFNELKKICKKNKIGTIKMEVCRTSYPNITFLKKVRKFADKNKIVLIFDECTTGFRETLGGLHKKVNIKPDLCIFGKALGNGYPITAVIGKKNIMDCVKSTFISSTFWSERAGYAAALKTIEIMEKKRTWKKITRIGNKIQKRWKKIFQKEKLDVKINGIPSLANFTFSNNHQKYKTFITQEMLKQNILASNLVYCSVAHTDRVLEKYFIQFEKIIKIIKKCETEENIDNYLKTSVSVSDFKRLN